MKVLVTGVAGQLGHDVMNELAKRGHEGVGSDLAAEYSGIADGSAVTKMPYVSMDITDAAAVEMVLQEVKPDAVVHCAAWTAVDLAEDDDKVDKVRSINAGGTKNIAEVCKKLDCKMVYLSTDYVFDGQGTKPWDPDCKTYQPLNVYGQTKLEGELAVSETLDKYFIVRIAWVFGINGKNFIKTMLNVGKTHDTLKVVSDQVGTPTYTYDLARLLVDMIETDKYGYYHVTNEGGYISWYDFTKEIFRQAVEQGHTEYAKVDVFAQTFGSLDRKLLAVDPLHDIGLFRLGIGKVGLIFGVDLIQRGFRDIHIPLIDEGGGQAVEHRQHQGADLITIHISIGTDDDLVKAQVVQIKGSQVLIVAAAQLHAAAHHADQVCDNVRLENAGVIGLQAVQDLAANGHDSLELRIAALFDRAHSGIALHDVQFAAGGILGAAVHKFLHAVGQVHLLGHCFFDGHTRFFGVLAALLID